MEISLNFDKALNTLLKNFGKDKIAILYYLDNIAQETSTLSLIWTEIYQKIFIEFNSIRDNNKIVDKEFLNEMKNIFNHFLSPENDLGYRNCLRYYDDLGKMFNLKISEKILQDSINTLGRIIYMRNQVFEKVENIINDFLNMSTSNDKILDLAQFIAFLREDASKLEYISKTYKINNNLTS